MTTSTTSYMYDDGDQASTSALFSGDEGTLDALQRRVLVLLLKQRFMTSESHTAEWKALIANPTIIRSRLNDLFLDLVIDTERQVAFKRQVAAEGSGRPFPTLLYDAAWKREETILLVNLRSKARAEQAAGVTRVYVDRVDMLEDIAQHRAASDTDLALASRRAKNAIDSLFSAGLLIGKADGERYEISRAIDALLPLETLKSLQEWLEKQNDPDTADITDADLEVSTEDEQ
jgi:hypothetical protein